MAEVQQKKRERRVSKQGSGGFGLGGVIAVGGAIAAAALLGAVRNRATKRRGNSKSNGVMSDKITDGIDSKITEEEVQGLRTLLQTSPLSLPKHQPPADNSKAEESSSISSMRTGLDASMVIEIPVKEEKPIMKAKEEERAPSAENFCLVPDSFGTGRISVQDGSSGNEGDAEVELEGYSVSRGKPGFVEPSFSQIVDHIDGNPSYPSSVDQSGTFVDRSQKTNCEEVLPTLHSMQRVQEQQRPLHETLDVLMESGIEGQGEGECQEGRENSFVVINVAAVETDASSRGSNMEEVPLEGSHTEEERDEVGHHGTGNELVRPNDEVIILERADIVGRDDLIELKDDDDREAACHHGSENELMVGNHEGGKGEAASVADDDLLEVNGVQEKEGAAYLVAENNSLEQNEKEYEAAAAYYGTGDDFVKPNDEEEEVEAAHVQAGTGLEELDDVKEEAAAAYHDATLDHLITPKERENKEEAAEVFEACSDSEKQNDEVEEQGPFNDLDVPDGRGKKEKADYYGGEGARETKEIHVEERGACFGAGWSSGEASENEGEDAADVYRAGNDLVGLNEEGEKEVLHRGAWNDPIMETSDEEDKEASDETGGLSPESNDEEKDGEGSDGTGSSSIESTAEAVWPVEFLEGSLLEKNATKIGTEIRHQISAEESVDKEVDNQNEKGDDEPIYKEKVNVQLEKEQGDCVQTLSMRRKSGWHFSLPAMVAVLLFVLVSHLLAKLWQPFEVEIIEE